MPQGDHESGQFRRVRDVRGRGTDRVIEPRNDRTEQAWQAGVAGPRVRLAQVSLDESMFSIIVRIDEALLTRDRIGDTETLNRIQELFTSRFRNFGL